MKMVSVIIPTYNYASYICEAINSVLSQIYSGQIEIIVVDDGSTDNTKEVVKPYIDRNDIQYYFQQNKGKAEATSVAITKCQGKYIFNLDADDYFLPNKIDSTVKIFELDNNIVHVASPAKILYQDTQKHEVEQLPVSIVDNVIDGDWLLDFFYTKNILFGGGTTYAARADVLKEIVIPCEVDMYIDEFLLLAILSKGKSYFIKSPLSVWRVHSLNYSGNSTSNKNRIEKDLRLLNSSKAVLNYLETNAFNKKIVNIYYLIDKTRNLSYKEQINKKTFSDILNYAKMLALKVKPGLTLIKNYNVINRFIPLFMLKKLKKIKSKA